MSMREISGNRQRCTWLFADNITILLIYYLSMALQTMRKTTKGLSH